MKTQNYAETKDKRRKREAKFFFARLAILFGNTLKGKKRPTFVPFLVYRPKEDRMEAATAVIG